MLEVVIGCVLGAVSTAVIIRIMFNPEKIMENLIDFIVTDEEIQKKLFIIGALIGNGIKTGVGITPKGGKFKFTDLFTQALAQFLFPKLSGGEEGQEQPSSPSTPLKNIFERLKRA